MPDATTPHTVFVSHAHADNELCDSYVAALRARGLDVWYDRTNMQVGHSLSADIEAELRRRTAFLVIATQASLASQWVRSEIAAFRSLVAREPARLFVPVRAAPCEMPLLWVDILWIDAVALGFDSAIDALAKALRAPTAPVEHVEDLLARGKSLDTQKQWAEALTTYERALLREPNNTDAWNGKGTALFCLKRFEEALAAYGRALALDSDNAAAWLGRARALGSLSGYEEALAACEQALALDPNNADVWGAKSMLLIALQRYDESQAAEDRYEALTAPERKRQDDEERERYEPKLAAYEQALALDPRNVEAWINKGHTLDRLKRYEEALVAYDRALALDPNNARAWALKMFCLSFLGRMAEAHVANQRARELYKPQGD